MMAGPGTLGADGIGRRLKLARELGGISARELDRLASLTEGHTSQIERGAKFNPGADISERVARVLGLSLDWLISGLGPSPTSRAVKSAIARHRKDSHRS